MVARCTFAEIASYLKRLSGEQRRCLAMRFFWGLSVTQTAQAMHRTEEAVRALQYRAIRHLTEMLANDEVFDSLRAS